ncbi:zf-HC2 domain-containing protein [Alicyclobacillus curvatus]|nr:zf-HC2 domain-containing protein [Alicyclobacillus curvatus]
MTCEIVQSKLTAYVDHQLPQDEWQQIHAHVPTCAHCREIVIGLQSTTVELDHYFQAVIAPFGFEDEVTQSLNDIRQARHMNRLMRFSSFVIPGIAEIRTYSYFDHT